MENVGITVVEKIGHPLRGIGGQALDLVTGTDVERVDRIVDRLIADLVNGLVGGGDQFGELLAEVAGNFQGLVPGNPHQQHQRHHLDRDEHQDQAHPYRESIPVIKEE